MKSKLNKRKKTELTILAKHILGLPVKSCNTKAVLVYWIAEEIVRRVKVEMIRQCRPEKITFSAGYIYKLSDQVVKAIGTSRTLRRLKENIKIPQIMFYMSDGEKAAPGRADYILSHSGSWLSQGQAKKIFWELKKLEKAVYDDLLDLQIFEQVSKKDFQPSSSRPKFPGSNFQVKKFNNKYTGKTYTKRVKVNLNGDLAGNKDIFFGFFRVDKRMAAKLQQLLPEN